MQEFFQISRTNDLSRRLQVVCIMRRVRYTCMFGSISALRNWLLKPVCFVDSWKWLTQWTRSSISSDDSCFSQSPLIASSQVTLVARLLNSSVLFLLLIYF